MGKCLSRIVSVLCCAVMGTVLSAQDENLVVRVGRHYRLVFHAADLTGEIAGKVVDQASIDVEALWATLQKVHGLGKTSRGTIHLYRDEAEFRRVELRLSPHKFQNDAFVADDLIGHVWLWPHLAMKLLSVTGFPASARESLLRTATDQVVAPLVPEWDHEGWMRAVLVMGSLELHTNPKRELGVDWAFDWRRKLISTRRRAGKDITVARTTRPRMVTSSRDRWDETLAFCALLGSAMADANSKWARRFVDRYRAPSGNVSHSETRWESIKRGTGRSTRKFEAAFEAMCERSIPTWVWVKALWVPGSNRSMLVGTRGQTGTVQSVARLPRGDYAISGQLTFDVGEDYKVRVSFGWDGGSSIAAVFDEKKAGISVWDNHNGKMIDHAEVAVATVKGMPLLFRIEVTAEEVTVICNDKLSCEWKHGGRQTHTACAIEVNERIVWLSNLRIEPLNAGKKK